MLSCCPGPRNILGLFPVVRLCAVALSPSFASRFHLFQWDPLAARVGCASGRLICFCQRSKLFDFSQSRRTIIRCRDTSLLPASP